MSTLSGSSRVYVFTPGVSVAFSTFVATGDDRPLTFEQLPFDHPVFILYSSGTTGVPKCIVHGCGVRIVLQTVHIYVSYNHLSRVFCLTA